jgi:MoxR-like ATPase
MEYTEIKSLADRIKENISKVIVGKESIIELLLSAVISQGHVLLEDVPGMGKTLLAKSLALSIDCGFRRIQFTPDLLPTDITGLHFFNQKESEFTFRPGPVFSNIILADEINRATPRTQSALLECMEEYQVTIDGVTKNLERPFLVIATQNPVEIQGTFPLPEAQLDRFMMRLKIGYPSTDEGIDILKRFKENNPTAELKPVCSRQSILEAMDRYMFVHVCDDVLKYITRLAEATRTNPDIVLGVSPRGTQALLRAVQAYAVIKGRDYATPDDVKILAIPVLAHRLILKGGLRLKSGAAEDVLKDILQKTPVPTEENIDFATA